ncbi:hypothetical protein ACFL2Q_00105 [Thermodesulfobacteriota bacterium]
MQKIVFISIPFVFKENATEMKKPPKVSTWMDSQDLFDDGGLIPELATNEGSGAKRKHSRA